MISYPLLKQSVRSNCRLFLAFAVILTIYIVLIVGMYDPLVAEKIEGLLSALPKEILSAFGFDMQNQTLTGFVASYLFGFLLLVFPMLYVVLTASRLIASKVESGSMVYLIGTPNSRLTIAYTQAVFLAGSTGVLFLYTAALGTGVCEWMYPGLLRIGTYLDLCMGAFALQFLIGGISFFASCTSSDTKKSMLYGAGVPLVFYLIHMLANMGGSLEFLRYLTIFTLFDTERILAVDTVGYIFMGIMGTAGILFYAAGIITFRKRDLSI